MKSEHYFTKRPTSELKTKTISILFDSHRCTFETPSGVFSSGDADHASLLLAKYSIVKENWTVLDLGCGWGLIGILLKKRFPLAAVTATDINERALAYTKKNAQSNNISIDVYEGSLYEPVKGKKFNTIITNPPMKAGRELCYQIIEQAKDHLEKDGMLQLVAAHNRGGKMLEAKMKEVFGNVETSVKKSGLRVYMSRMK